MSLQPELLADQLPLMEPRYPASLVGEGTAAEPWGNTVVWTCMVAAGSAMRKLCFPSRLRQLPRECRAGGDRRNLKQLLCSELPSLTTAGLPAATSP